MAKARKVTADNLAEAIAEILDEYGDETDKHIDEITAQVAKKGVQALRSASSVFNGTKYKSGWAVDYTITRYSKSAHIWNKKVPGLPHLLENGHLLRNGRHSNGRVHIKPIEDQLTREFFNQLEHKL